jgi:hypothetical protein
MRAIDVSAESGRIDISVDSPTTGVVIVDIKIGSQSTPAPLHWRAGDWTKPPLDISLSPEGLVESIQVVFQDEEVTMVDGDVATEEEPGVPSFRVDEWPADRYLDVRTGVRAVRLASGELLVSIDDEHPARLLRIGDGVGLGLDASGRVVQVVMGPLDAEQWRLIGAAAT